MEDFLVSLEVFLFGEKMPENIAKTFAPVKIPLLGDIPYIGEVLFTQDVFVYLGYIASVLLGIYLYKTRTGLNLRAVGENTKAADTAGIGITKYKYMHILLGGALCGLGGAYLSVVEVGQWQEHITAGRGWIAIALVIFCNWNPFKALICAFFLWWTQYIRISDTVFEYFSELARYDSLYSNHRCFGY